MTLLVTTAACVQLQTEQPFCNSTRVKVDTSYTANVISRTY